MDAEKFLQLVNDLPIGKRLPRATYLHMSALTVIDSSLSDFIWLIAKAGQVNEDQWNIVKLYSKDFRLSFLHYPDFFDSAYPILRSSITIDLKHKSKKEVDYRSSDNPPILHRKELFVLEDHPEYESFCMITAEGEAAGLYENPRRIGFQKSWHRLITQSGYTLIDDRLFRTAAMPTNSSEQGVDRHKTAIPRQGLSAPMKTLAKHGYISGEFSIFDYGCGLGDDLRELEAHGIDAAGWDPGHLPDADVFDADIVNLGFVINVIEDRDERIEALVRSYELAGRLLVVSAMLANDSHIQKFQQYKDGVLTSRNTFQKYFAQSELQAFIEQTLEESAIAVGPGIFYVFKDKLEEQIFLSKRQRRHHQWKQLTQRPATTVNRSERLINENPELCDRFWQSCLELGRIPFNEEFPDLTELSSIFGSAKRLFNLLAKDGAMDDFLQSQAYRREDVTVYLALALLGKRKPYTQLNDALKRDVKALFGTYDEAKRTAREALFQVANVGLIYESCIEAHEALPASVLEQQHSLTLHINYLESLPLLLRLYVGCATQLYGEFEGVSLIKIHIASGKVSLMVYEGFDDTPLPMLRERIKVKMREQDVDFYDYVDGYAPQPLYLKSMLIDHSFSDYSKQQSFDRRLQKLVPEIKGLIGPSKNELYRQLHQRNKEIRGYRFYNCP